MSHLYQLCCSCLGKTVRIRTRDGRLFTGRMHRVTPTHAHLLPIGRHIADNQQARTSEAYPALGTGGSDLPQGKEIFWFGFPLIIPLAAIVGLTIVGTAPFWGWGGLGSRGFGGPGLFW